MFCASLFGYRVDQSFRFEMEAKKEKGNDVSADSPTSVLEDEVRFHFFLSPSILESYVSFICLLSAFERFCLFLRGVGESEMKKFVCCSHCWLSI